MELQESRVITLREPLRTLTPDQVSQIDRYLTELTAFGRLTLIKRDGKLRFIERTESLESIPLGREMRRQPR
jgi:hypothetical protein